MFVFTVFGQIYQICLSNTNINIPLFYAVIDQVQIHKYTNTQNVKWSVYWNTNTYITQSLLDDLVWLCGCNTLKKFLVFQNIP